MRGVDARGGEAADERVVWQDAECGAYADDLTLWRELAAGRPGPVLDLGCGAGRVTLDLATAGHEVWGLDRDPRLIAELTRRAEARRVSVVGLSGDCRGLDLGRRFGLIIASMQLVQLLGGTGGRRAMLERVAAHLASHGLFAAAVVEGIPPGALSDDADALPDVREVEGSVYSSLPLGVTLSGGVLEVRRLRQVVSGTGELSEQLHAERLDVLDAPALEAEAVGCGLVPAGRREIPAGDAHVGSTVVLLEVSG